MPSTFRRRNGYSSPYSKMQIATWVILPVLVISFFVFCSPVLPLAASIPVSIVYFIITAVAVYYTHVACKEDPMDVHLALHLYRESAGDDAAFSESLDIPKTPPSTFWYKPPDFSKLSSQNAEAPMKYCWVCETSVAEHSMHCKYCNKCVSNFDHHCQWLNSCIGEANYTEFYYALWWLCGMLFSHVAVLIGLIIDYFLDGTTLRRAKGWMKADANTALAAIWIFFLIFIGIALAMMLQLLWFHINLRRENLTTYQFILRDAQRKREEVKYKETRSKERADAVVSARTQGKGFLATRLELGERCCAACDPLPPTVLEGENNNGNGQQQTSTGNDDDVQQNGNSYSNAEDVVKDHSDEADDEDKEQLEPKTAVTSSSSLSELEGGATISSNGEALVKSLGREEDDDAIQVAIDERQDTEQEPTPIVWEKV